MFFCAMCYRRRYQDHREHSQLIDKNTLKQKLDNFQNYFLRLSFDASLLKSPFVKIVNESDNLFE
jgi:hypothetical protein